MTDKIQNPNDQNVLGIESLGIDWKLRFGHWDFKI